MAIGLELSGTWRRMVVAALTGRRIAQAHAAPRDPRPGTSRWSPRRGLWSAALQLASAICRHYWPRRVAGGHCCPGAAAGSCWSRPSSTGWWTGSAAGNADDDAKPIGLLTYLLLKRVDDLAYGLGLWYGVVRERNVGAAQTADSESDHLTAAALHSDVLIIGAGSAGSVVAERLSADPRCR